MPLHFVFCMLHVAAVVFMLPALFVTIPAHLIYAAVVRGSTLPRSARLLRPCPYCSGFVHPEAQRCKHCKRAIAPAAPQDQRPDVNVT